MDTAFLLMARYEALAVVPIELVCRDYFSHLTPLQLQRKINAGELALPLLRMEGNSQKAAKGVHINDLAAWIDARRAVAVKECEQLTGASISRRAGR
ncbi:Pyocin activator protein PrtN [Burkholderia lata]|uniref:pyocin activator PrtN family protein n=1 Tax=Burkholderia lata (strain ATCC 17760 / DSM 23089 / LMG 22485 / NCIMB 9086 / R18194 / 383) TaxID=482957 RepID=UPI0014531376|nr:pyocin activator PrtN family protein [Burkholderia lata]VWC40521.1 Pyocin activator protein PrtN [Burkholderia lata]